MCLVGCKSDSDPSLREVTREEAHVLAIELKARYVETSAKTGEGVEKTFQMLARGIQAEMAKPKVRHACHWAFKLYFSPRRSRLWFRGRAKTWPPDGRRPA